MQIIPFVLVAFSAVSSQARVAGVDRVTAPTVFVGRVLTPDGRPARDAVVESSAGGRALASADGRFALHVAVPLDVECVEVTASLDGPADANGFVASVRVLPAALSTTTSVGTLLLAPSPGCHARWVPEFGGLPGMDDPVKALAVFDDGAGPALYAGGDFAHAGGVSAHYIARWDGSGWSALAGEPNGTVEALAVFDDGGGPALYAGGSFFAAGGVPASGIARWDGASWSAFGLGASNYVEALIAFDDGSGPALYVGGYLASAGGEAAVAKWDGSSWSTLGGAFSSVIGPVSLDALAFFDDGSGPALYAGGHFNRAGGVHALRIARWNGSTWSSVAGGMNGPVYGLAVFDDGSGPALHAGGDFTTAGGASANGIARWNGSSWSALGNGMTGGSATVEALAVFDDGSGAALYAGGDFTHAGGTAANRIARWAGASWSALGSGTGGPEPTVQALVSFDGGGGAELYAGGTFTSAGGAARSRIARWDGERWSSAGRGQGLGIVDNFDPPRVHALTAGDDGSGSALYAGGDFDTAGGVVANGVGRWDGERWSALGSGMNSMVECMAMFDDGGGPALHAGGFFTSAGGTSANGIARWDGSEWSALGGGVTGGSLPTAYALAVFDDGGGAALYVGGRFTTAGGVTVNNIARWDGSSWSALGSGITGSVYDLVVFDDGGGPSLYAGGSFSTAGGLAANSIARWDGASWSTLGSGVAGSYHTLYALAVFDGGAGPALYAGGAFTSAGGVPATCIARWDGATWSAVGSGTDGQNVLALAVFDDGNGPALYAGGVFWSVGGVSTNQIAKWDGTSWSALGTGLSGVPGNVYAYALAVFDDGGGPALHVGGRFDDSPARDRAIAKWGCARRVRGAGF